MLKLPSIMSGRDLFTILDSSGYCYPNGGNPARSFSSDIVLSIHETDIIIIKDIISGKSSFDDCNLFILLVKCIPLHNEDEEYIEYECYLSVYIRFLDK